MSPKVCQAKPVSDTATIDSQSTTSFELIALFAHSLCWFNTDNRELPCFARSRAQSRAQSLADSTLAIPSNPEKNSGMCEWGASIRGATFTAINHQIKLHGSQLQDPTRQFRRGLPSIRGVGRLWRPNVACCCHSHSWEAEQKHSLADDPMIIFFTLRHWIGTAI